MVYQIDPSNEGERFPSSCGSSVMDKIKMRINFLLSDSNMKIDFLRGRPRCRHSQHSQNPKAVDNGEMERGIHVRIITDKLVKVKSEVDYTLDAVRQGSNSSRAHNAKLRLLKELENFDYDLHEKLQHHLLANDPNSRFFRDSFYVIGGEERSVDGRIRSENERNHVRTKASLNAPTATLRTKSSLDEDDDEDDEIHPELQGTEVEPQKKKTWAFFNQF